MGPNKLVPPAGAENKLGADVEGAPNKLGFEVVLPNSPVDCCCVDVPKVLPNAGAADEAGAPKVAPKAGAADEAGAPKVVPKEGAVAPVAGVPKVEPKTGACCVLVAPKVEPKPKPAEDVVAGVAPNAVPKPVAKNAIET